MRVDCFFLTGELPKRLGALPARQVSGAPQRAAAWGNPPVVLRCGVEPPSQPVTGLLTINGVDWVAQPGAHVVKWTTVGREVTVQVVVPKAYSGQGPLMARLAPAISDAVPKAPSGGP